MRVLPDAPRAGLNAALRHAAAVAAASYPDAGLAALAGDLPALRPGELDRALAAAAAAGGRSFVADAAGDGTVLLCATAGVELRPAFGSASRAEHAVSGARDLTAVLANEVAGLRHDVDTVDDLSAAAALGLGPATRRAATPGAGGAEAWQDLSHDAGAGVPGPAPGRPPAQAPQRAAGTA